MSTTGPIRHADLMAGQYEDRRVDDGPWNPVGIVEHDLGVLTSSPAPPVRRIETIRPHSVTRLSPTRQIVDLGQNITGWMQMSDLGPAGTDITLVHAEALDPSGDVTLDHLGSATARCDRSTGSISAGIDGDTFEPRHTIHGFQYVQVDGAPPLTPDDATGVVVHTDLRRTGWFHCSDDRLNRLHEIADWSFRDNACDIPTDCPHRERQGWTGDWQIFLPSAAFLYDVAGFSVKWLRSLADEQLPDGLLPNYVPDPRRWKAVENDDLTLVRAARLGRLGRCQRARALGAVPPIRRSRNPRRDVADDEAVVGLCRRLGAHQTPPDPRRCPPDATPARGVPVGRRLALG